MRISLWTLHKSLAGLAGAAVLLALSGTPTLTAQDPPSGPALCVRGFSKILDGSLSGPWTSGGCGTACKTAQGEAALLWSIRPNPSGCEAGANCDEAPGLDGRLRAKLKVNVRAHRPCPYRGAYEGTIELTDATGLVVATGRVQATLGVGTHQKPCTGPTCPTVPRCETCYDVAAVQNTWRIGTEGIIDAPVTAGRYRGCRIRASLQGDFQTGWGGPFGTPWSSRGNLDGVVECPCVLTQ